TRRGSGESSATVAFPTTPSPRSRHKPKIPDAWGDDRFILTNTARGVHRPRPSIHHQPRPLAVGHFCSSVFEVPPIAPRRGLAYIRRQDFPRELQEALALWRVNSSTICTACRRPIRAARRSSTT